MSSILYTVQNIVDEIRDLLDEQNIDSVSTEKSILPSINRGQDFAFDILSRKYPEPILKHAPFALNGTDQEYDMPEDAFEDRVQKIEIQISPGNNGKSTYRPVERISYRDISDYETISVTNVPSYYCIIGRKIRFVSPPSGTYSARIWYLRNIEPLCLPQGRITVANTTSNYVILDSTGDSLTTQADQLGSYVNIVDGQTGVIKGTMQIQILNENKVTFRSTPTRNSVLNREVSGSLADLNISLDDYLSPIRGTCVPYYSKPVVNFLIQYAVAEIGRSRGGAADADTKVLENFEKQVERTWVGREMSLRVKKKSRYWGQQMNRWFFNY